MTGVELIAAALAVAGTAEPGALDACHARGVLAGNSNIPNWDKRSRYFDIAVCLGAA